MKGIALAALAAAAAVSGAAPPPAPSSPPDSTGRALERWSTANGWVPVENAPAHRPSATWTRSIESPADVWTVGEVVVAAEPTNDDGVRLRRIDPATGDDRWTSTYDVDVDVERRDGVAISADGRFVLARIGRGRASTAGPTLLIDADDGREVAVVEQSWTADAQAIDGLTVIARHGAIGVDVKTGEERWRYGGHLGWIEAWLRGGHVIVSAFDDDYLGLLDPATGELLWHVPWDHYLRLWAIDEVVVGVLWNTADAPEVRIFEVASGDVTTAEIEKFDYLSAYPGTEGVVVLIGSPGDPTAATAIDINTGERRWAAELRGEGHPEVYRLDGDVFLVDAAGSQVQVLDGATGEELTDAAASAQADDVGAMIYHAAGDAVSAVTLPTLAEQWQLDVPHDSIAAVDGGFIAIESDAGGYTLTGYLADRDA